MNKKYLKLGVLLVGLLAFFGGVNEAKAGGCDSDTLIFDWGACDYYGLINTGKYEVKAYGYGCDFKFKGGSNDDWSFQSRDLAYSSEVKNWVNVGKQSVNSMRDKYDEFGCPALVVWSNPSASSNKMNLNWITKNNIEEKMSRGDNSDHWLYNVSDDYYNGTAQQFYGGTDNEGMNIQIKNLNNDIQPYFEEIYGFFSGLSVSGTPLYNVTINGVASNIKPYVFTNGADGEADQEWKYARMISQGWKVVDPVIGNVSSVTNYSNYSKYYISSNDDKTVENNMKDVASNNFSEFKSVSEWASEVVEVYEILTDAYSDGIDAINKIPNRLNGLEVWCADNRPLLGWTEKTYKDAANEYVARKNDYNTDTKYWLDDQIKKSFTEPRKLIEDSVRQYAKYAQFTVEIGKTTDGNPETILTQWVKYLEEDLNNYSEQILDINTMCQIGYDVANEKISKNKNYKDIASNFKNCLSISNKLISSFSSLESSYNLAAKDLGLSSFNWREEVMATCENMFSDDLLNILSTIYFFIEVVVVVLAVILSMVDFFKATANSDADAMKKAWGKVIKRVIIIIVLFLLPIIVNFTLKTFGVIEENQSTTCFNYDE